MTLEEREIYRRKENEFKAELEWLRRCGSKEVSKMVELNKELYNLTQAKLRNAEEERGRIWWD